MVDDLAG